MAPALVPTATFYPLLQLHNIQCVYITSSLAIYPSLNVCCFYILTILLSVTMRFDVHTFSNQCVVVVVVFILGFDVVIYLVRCSNTES